SQQLERLSDDEETWWRALARKRAVLDEATAMAFARQEGLEEGRQEGIEHGQAKALAHQLTLKFGAFPDSLRPRLEHADEVMLNTWLERVLFAETLEDVFR